MPHGTVLIVEDEPEVADVLEFNLRAAGFDTVTASDGLTACRLVGSQPPDLILLDLLLPDLQGWEICRMIRSHRDPAVAELPVVMLTALASTADKVRGLELGADDYLTKPFSVREVVLKVRSLIEKRRASAATARRLRDLEADRQTDRDLQGLLFHELRNKLLVIGGFSNRLAREADPAEPSQRYARVIHQTSQYLSALAEQVLLLRRLEAGGMELPAEEVDLGEVTGGVAELHEGAARERGIRLHWEEDPGVDRKVRGNAVALRVCLSNLVENAVRYSPAGTTVTVRTGRRPGHLFLEVDDQGPGVPEEERERVFERFFRGRTAQGVSGTGLGLYVVRTLTEALGGNVKITTGPGGRGTRVRIQIPQPQPPVDETDASPDTAKASTCPRGALRSNVTPSTAQVLDG